jgi:hypothetical protein
MSNRSLAAARNRRAQQEIVSDPSFKGKSQFQQPPKNYPPSKLQTPGISSQGPPGPPSQSKSQTNTSKLSISDVIGLVTIRLSKLEAYMLKEQNEHSSKTSSGNADTDTIVRNLVNRVGDIEKSHSGIKKTIEDATTSIEETNKIVDELVEQSATLSSVEVQAPIDPSIYEKIENNTREIAELKQLIMKLQTMFIETRLSSLSSYPSVTPTPFPSVIPSNPSSSTLSIEEIPVLDGVAYTNI